MTSRTSSTVISVLGFLVFSSVLCAQTAKIPTLEEILQGLEANLDHYDTSVPSLFCDEHVISQVEPGVPNQDTITDSVFRLKRTPNPDHSITLVESREVKNIDGNAAAKQDLDGPTLLSGVFEGGLAVVSLKQAACTNYALERVNRNSPARPYSVRFATVLTPQNSADCLLKENTKGRAFIDPASMQIRTWNSLRRVTPSSPGPHIGHPWSASGSSQSTMRLFCSAARPSGCPPRSPCVQPAVPEPSTRWSGRSGPPIATITGWKSRRAFFRSARHLRRDSA